MTKKEKRIRKEDFMINKLPQISLYYEVVEYPHFFKIKIKDRVYDYYPGAGRCRDCVKLTWFDIEPDKLLNGLLNGYI